MILLHRGVGSPAYVLEDDAPSRFVTIWSQIAPTSHPHQFFIFTPLSPPQLNFSVQIPMQHMHAFNIDLKRLLIPTIAMNWWYQKLPTCCSSPQTEKKKMFSLRTRLSRAVLVTAMILLAFVIAVSHATANPKNVDTFLYQGECSFGGVDYFLQHRGALGPACGPNLSERATLANYGSGDVVEAVSLQTAAQQILQCLPHMVHAASQNHDMTNTCEVWEELDGLGVEDVLDGKNWNTHVDDVAHTNTTTTNTICRAERGACVNANRILYHNVTSFDDVVVHNPFQSRHGVHTLRQYFGPGATGMGLVTMALCKSQVENYNTLLINPTPMQCPEGEDVVTVHGVIIGASAHGWSKFHETHSQYNTRAVAVADKSNNNDNKLTNSTGLYEPLLGTQEVFFEVCSAYFAAVVKTQTPCLAVSWNPTLYNFQQAPLNITAFRFLQYGKTSAKFHKDVQHELAKQTAKPAVSGDVALLRRYFASANLLGTRILMLNTLRNREITVGPHCDTKKGEAIYDFTKLGYLYREFCLPHQLVKPPTQTRTVSLADAHAFFATYFSFFLADIGHDLALWEKNNNNNQQDAASLAIKESIFIVPDELSKLKNPTSRTISTPAILQYDEMLLKRTLQYLENVNNMASTAKRHEWLSAQPGEAHITPEKFDKHYIFIKHYVLQARPYQSNFDQEGWARYQVPESIIMGAHWDAVLPTYFHRNAETANVYNAIVNNCTKLYERDFVALPQDLTLEMWQKDNINNNNNITTTTTTTTHNNWEVTKKLMACVGEKVKQQLTEEVVLNDHSSADPTGVMDDGIVATETH